MKRNKKRRGLQQDLNITNLVDVTFAILVVFMITAPLMSKGIQVDLPKTNAPSIEDKEIIRVSIDEGGTIFLEKREVNLQSLKLEFRKTWDGQSPVAVNADSSASYGRVMQVVGSLQDMGVEKLGFLTRSPGKVQ